MKIYKYLLPLCLASIFISCGDSSEMNISNLDFTPVATFENVETVGNVNSMYVGEKVKINIALNNSIVAQDYILTYLPDPTNQSTLSHGESTITPREPNTASLGVHGYKIGNNGN